MFRSRMRINPFVFSFSFYISSVINAVKTVVSYISNVHFSVMLKLKFKQTLGEIAVYFVLWIFGDTIHPLYFVIMLYAFTFVNMSNLLMQYVFSCG
jgi:hypothetical protein